MPQPRRPRRWNPWLVTSYAVLIAAVVGLLFLNVRAMELHTGVRAVLEAESRWSSAEGRAFLHGERYAATGDADELRRFHEALAFPHAVRPAIRHSVENPGDEVEIRRILAADPLTRDEASTGGRLSRRLGGNEILQDAVAGWVEADRILEALEAEVVELAARAEAAGFADAGPEAALERIRELSRGRAAPGATITDEFARWVDAVGAGVRRTVALSSIFFLLAGILVLHTVSRRIARSESALREGESRFRQVVEGLHEIVWLSAADKSELYYVSPAFERVFERPVEEMYRDPRAWLEWIHPEDRERVENAVPLQAQGGYDEEYRMILPDGRVRWIRDRAFPVLSPEGRITRIAGIAEDVTQQRDIRSEMLETHKLRSVARLAAGLAHDFNNQLTVIESHTQLLLADLGTSPRFRNDLDAVRDAARACSALTRQLLAFGRRQVLVPRTIAPVTFLQDSLPVLVELLPESIDLDAELPSDPLARMRADPAHLREALMNVVAHVGSEIPDESRVRLRLHGLRSTTPVEVEGADALAPGRYIAFEVRGSGPGLPEAIRARLFEPFHRGLQQDGASGLELASALGILQQSGGGIQVEASSEGMAFTLLVPAEEPARTGRTG